MFRLRNSLKCAIFVRKFGNRSRKSLENVCKKLADNELKHAAFDLDKKQKFPKKQIAELGKLGLMAITVPEVNGGSGLDMSSLSIAVEEISRGCASTGAIVSIHNILYADFLATHGTYRQKELYLRPYTTGVPGAFALSEAEAGSDVANISTTATRKGDCYILNGTKTWVTSAKEAEIAIIFASVNKNLEKRGITGFIVPLNGPGIHIGEADDKLGIRATSTCEINLCDVSVPLEDVIGGIGGGFKIAMSQLNKARIGIASQALGIAQAALDTALEYAINRRAFGKTLADMQAVQLRLARMATQIEAARLLVRKAAALCDNNANIIKHCAMAKLAASEAATFSAHQCIQILGGMGYVEKMPAARYYRDARITEIYGGVSDIQMLIIAEQMLKDWKCDVQN